MKVCSVEDCGRKHLSRGFCGMHYKRNRKMEISPTKVAGTPRCALPGCSKVCYCTRPLCKKHWFESQGIIRPTCSMVGCDRDAYGLGLCDRHWKAQYPGPSRRCSVPECGRPHVGLGYCQAHYDRVRRCGDAAILEKIPERPAFWTTSCGYRLVVVPKGTPGIRKKGVMAEHRWVMQQMLGRPLLPSEDVHHINGVRSDNRPENLELWSKSRQPRGQRVEDHVRWAREILTTYGDLVERAAVSAHLEKPKRKLAA